MASQRLAGEFRAELARQKRTAGEAAAAIGVTPHTMGRRLNGDVPLNMVEHAALCRWLGIEPAEMMRRANGDVEAVMSA